MTVTSLFSGGLAKTSALDVFGVVLICCGYPVVGLDLQEPQICDSQAAQADAAITRKERTQSNWKQTAASSIYQGTGSSDNPYHHAAGAAPAWQGETHRSSS